MNINRIVHIGFISIILFLAIFHIYISTLIPVSGFYNIDENIAVHSGMLLMVNTIPICLEWPGGPMLIGISTLSYLELFLQTPFLQAMLSANVLDASREINSYIATHINSPEFYSTVRKAMQIAFLFLIPFFLILKRLSGMNGKWLVLAGILSSPTLLTAGILIHPDSLAVLFWIFLITHVLFDEFKTGIRFVLIIGIYSGILLSIKLTYFIAFPFIALYLIYYWTKNQTLIKAINNVFLWFGVAFVFFVALCPFLFANTLTVIKSFAGQLVSKSASGDNSIQELVTTNIPNLIVWPLLILALAGLIFGFMKKISPERILMLILFLVFCLPFFKTSATYIRYCFPLIPIMLFWAIDGWLVIKEKIKLQSTPILLAFYVATIIISGVHIFYIHNQFQNRFNCANSVLLKNFINSEIPANASIALQEDFMHLIEENEEALNRLIKLNSDPNRIMNKLKVENHAASGIPVGYFVTKDVFADHSLYTNKLFTIKLDYLKSGSANIPRYNVFYYSDFSYAANTSLSVNELDKIQKIEYFVTGKATTSRGTLLKHIDNNCEQQFYIYKSSLIE